MKRQSGFKQLISLMLMLALVVGLVPLGAFTSYGDVASVSNVDLDSTGNVKANYSSAENAIIITGTGTIKRAKWEALAQMVNPIYFSGSAWGWDSDTPEDFKIIFRGDSDKSILLCGTYSAIGIFEGFSNEIIFEVPVDLAPAVNDICYMFADTAAFNQPVDFNVTNVTDMHRMFRGAAAFNQPVNFSDTSNVTNMYGMFNNAVAFNQPVNFDTTNVTDMHGMFENAAAFNQPVNFNTASVTDMHGMFENAAAFNQPVNFNTASVTDMHRMFAGAAAFNQPVNFNTANVTNMSYMFFDAAPFNQEVNFDTQNVTNMSSMFRDAVAFNQPVNFNTANVTHMSAMFENAASFNQPVNFNTTNVTDMGNMFAGAASFNQPVNFNTANVTSMAFMFAGAASFNQPVNFNTTNVTDMNGVFKGAVAFNQPVNFNTANVTYMSEMFYDAASFNQPIDFIIDSVTDMDDMFVDAPIPSVRLTNTNTSTAAAIDATHAFDGNRIEELQFNGLKNASLDGFGVPYQVEKDGVVVKSGAFRTDGYIFDDYANYRVYLDDMAKPIADCQVDLIDAQLYSGSPNTPDVTVRSASDAAIILQFGSDYSVQYKDNVAAGTATVTLQGEGLYYGHKDVNFTIYKQSPNDDSSDEGDWIVVDEGGGASSDNSSTSDVSSNNSSPDGSTSAASVPAEPLNKQFSDVKLGDWFYDAVYDVVAKGLIKGTTDDTFSPQRNTSRAMLATILYRLADQPAVTTSGRFSDVAAGSWYDDAVKWAAANGIVTGYPDNSFKPNRDLTREQLVTMLYRYAKAQQRDVSGKADLSGYADNAAISAYAREAMQWAVGAGIINGVGGNSLAPQGSATRAQLAMMISRFAGK